MGTSQVNTRVLHFSRLRRVRAAPPFLRQAVTSRLRAPGSLAAESRWLALAYSYGYQHRLSRTIHESDRQRKAGAITRMTMTRSPARALRMKMLLSSA